MAAINANINWGKDNWKNIIEADGKGYYAYLPALFIYNDPNFDFFDKIEKGKYYNKDLFYDYRIGSHGATINKYYCGTAVAELPFFLAAHSLSYLLGFETDGYSKLYEIWISIGAVVYLLIGLIYLSATLRLYKINELQKSFVLLTAVFGTNLFTYTIVEPSLSHLYSFAFVSMFVYYAKSYFLFQHQNHLLFLAILLAIILLIRPVNGLIIFSLPFLAGSLSSLKQGLLKALKYKLHLIGCFCIFTAIVAIQFIYYKIATGHFFVYS